MLCFLFVFVLSYFLFVLAVFLDCPFLLTPMVDDWYLVLPEICIIITNISTLFASVINIEEEEN